jgi:hypothetical protein
MTQRRAVLILGAAGLALAGAIAVVVLLVLREDVSRAPAVPPGPPVVARASFSPPIHFFGDVVLGRVEIEADRSRVDPGSIELNASTRPYVRAGRNQVRRDTHGSVERVQYTLRLVCLRSDCTLSTPSSPRANPPTQRTFTLAPALVTYRLKGARGLKSVTAEWPALTVATRIGSARPDDFAFTTDLAVPKPSYATSPTLLVAVLTVLGLALVLVPAALALRGVPGRLLRGARGPSLSALERALLLLDWAARRDPSDRRRALERVALELGREGRGGLAEQPRVVAWSRPDPDPDVATAIGDELRSATVTGDGNHR